MEKFLKKRELVSFVVNEDTKVDIDTFLSRKVERSEKFALDATILPDGSYHGTVRIANEKVVTNQEYVFGKRHGKYTATEKKTRREYCGFFFDGVPTGYFSIFLDNRVISNVFYDERGTITRHGHFSHDACPLKCQMYGHNINYPHETYWNFLEDSEELHMVSVFGNGGKQTVKFRDIRKEEKERCRDYFISRRRSQCLPKQRMPEFLFSDNIEDSREKQEKPLRRICLP